MIWGWNLKTPSIPLSNPLPPLLVVVVGSCLVVVSNSVVAGCLVLVTVAVTGFLVDMLFDPPAASVGESVF